VISGCWKGVRGGRRQLFRWWRHRAGVAFSRGAPGPGLEVHQGVRRPLRDRRRRRFVEANGEGSALLSRDGVAFAVVTVAASAEGIDQVLWMRNPEKLAAARWT
jgi:hypothetical protein